MFRGGSADYCRPTIDTRWGFHLHPLPHPRPSDTQATIGPLSHLNVLNKGCLRGRRLKIVYKLAHINRGIVSTCQGTIRFCRTRVTQGHMAYIAAPGKTDSHAACRVQYCKTISAASSSREGTQLTTTPSVVHRMSSFLIGR